MYTNANSDSTKAVTIRIVILIMSNYSFAEQADMIFMYGRANGNGREAARLYQEMFPRRQQPNHKTFAAVFQRLRQSGMLFPFAGDRGRKRDVRTPHVEENILQLVFEDPSVSIREMTSRTQVSRMSIWRVLNEQLLHPYHLQRVQGLTPADFPARVNFCRWFVQQTANPEFVSFVLFTDEASFNRDGIINFHNQHLWAEENPYGTIQSKHQHKFTVNVWASVVGDKTHRPSYSTRYTHRSSVLRFPV